MRSRQRESEQREQREQGAVGAGAKSTSVRSGEHKERDVRAQ